MHPPFGFALFYLRSVAPLKPLSTVTGKRTEGVTTGHIYWGAIPVVIGIMVVLVILFPRWSSFKGGIGPSI